MFRAEGISRVFEFCCSREGVGDTERGCQLVEVLRGEGRRWYGRVSAVLVAIQDSQSNAFVGGAEKLRMPQHRSCVRPPVVSHALAKTYKSGVSKDGALHQISTSSPSPLSSAVLALVEVSLHPN